MNEIFDSQKIINEYADMIYRIALGHLENKSFAEDIVQDVFITYINHIKENGIFEDKNHEKRWLIRVTINLCYNENKSAKRKNTVPLADCNLLEANTDDRLLRYSLDKLKEKYRIVFELFYIDNFRISEISKILKISQANVKTRLKRAREMMKKIVQLGGEFSGRF